jgi:hypothetical protein
MYHDIIRNSQVLVLVYDHRRPMQMVWFPPAGNSESTEPIVALVAGDGSEPDMLYLVYPTGVSFKYEDKEFVILTIEKEKQMAKGQA